MISALSVRVCRTWDEFEQFRGPWNSLLQANPASSIFQTPEWLAAWWHAFGQDKRLLGLVFADSDGNAVGIAPSIRRTQVIFRSALRDSAASRRGIG